MRDENARIREKFELSLDGRQIASIVVGALVIVGVVFVLGLNVGRQISARHAEAAHPGDLEALDRAPGAAAAPVGGAALTFHDRLTKQRPAPQPEVVEAPKPAPPAPAAEPAPATADAAPQPTAAAAGEPSPAAAAPAPAAVALAAPTPAVAARTSIAAAEPPRRAAGGGFAVQLGAAQSRAEAERLAARFRAYHPRVEAATVAGKGHWYRVRAGSFGSRDAAERLRRDIARGTGASGYVVAE
jgi:cell division septation protein DedD